MTRFDRYNLLAALLAALPAVCTASVPPAPIASMSGGKPLCNRHFAMMLAADESADQYDANHWVVNGPGYALGIRAYTFADAIANRDSLRGKQRVRTISIPGRGTIERHRVLEWPGKSVWGWAYWVRHGVGDQPGYVSIASAQFTGSDADYPRLRRVLIGDERQTICPALNPDGIDG